MIDGDWRSAPAEQRAEAFATYLGYSGRYSISDEEVTHHIEVASDPNRVGRNISRRFRFEGNTLELTTPPTSVGGTAREFTLTWERVE
jgi:hypothetical protein